MEGLVEVYLTFEGRTAFLKTVDEAALRDGSEVARRQLDSLLESAICKRVEIRGTSPGPLSWVLNQMRKQGSSLRIRTGDRTFPYTLMLYQALEALQIRPPQPQVYGYLKGYISHAKLTPEDVCTIETGFGGLLEEESELWRMTAHHLAWSIFNKRFTDAERQAIMEECEKHSDLHGVVMAKMDEFQQREAGFAEKKARTKETKKINQSHRRARMRHENRKWEETHGLREASENTVRRLMNGQADYKIIDRTKKLVIDESPEEAEGAVEEAVDEGEDKSAWTDL